MEGETESTCKWRDDGEGNWATGCHNMFSIIDGTPTENEMKFCCFCGKPLEETNED